MVASIHHSDRRNVEWKPRRLSLEGFEGKHRDDLERAIRNVLSTEIAETTFAQVVDGLPVASVDGDRCHGHLSGLHPLRDKHVDLCPGVLERTKQLYDEFDVNLITFEAKASAARDLLVAADRRWD